MRYFGQAIFLGLVFTTSVVLNAAEPGAGTGEKKQSNPKTEKVSKDLGSKANESTKYPNPGWKPKDPNYPDPGWQPKSLQDKKFPIPEVKVQNWFL